MVINDKLHSNDGYIMYSIPLYALNLFRINIYIYKKNLKLIFLTNIQTRKILRTYHVFAQN